MKYALFLGCLIPTRLPQIESSTKMVLSNLGLEFIEDLEFLCCPNSYFIKSMETGTWLTIAARNLCIAEEQKLNVLALCPSCSHTLIEANQILKNDKKTRERVNEILKDVDKGFRGTIEVKHLLRALYEDIGLQRIKREVKKPLNLNVACHYGCHILKPSEIMQFDDVMDPKSMDEIIETLGGNPVDYENKDLCCGSAIETVDEDLSLNIAREKLKSFRNGGADAISTACPSCFFQYDFGQVKIRRRFQERYDLPVFYISQLIGLAMGFNAAEIGASLHKVRVERVFERMRGSR